MKPDDSQKQFTEKNLLENKFAKPIVLVTYDGNLLVKEKIKVLKYDHSIDSAQPTSKLNVLFAFSFNEYDAIKSNIKLNAKVEARKLKPITKRSKRSKVAMKEEYEAGTGINVQVTMRTGHVLSGYQLYENQYNLILTIHEVNVLVYKHGILKYQIIEEETKGGN